MEPKAPIRVPFNAHAETGCLPEDHNQSALMVTRDANTLGQIWCFVLPEIIGDAVQGDDVEGVWQERPYINVESPGN